MWARRRCPTWGFREITLVITIAKIIDPAYAPTTGLYKCKPRALFEGPIREALTKADIPHRKSGPLNIAKATAGLDDSWAAQRRPHSIAKVTVEIAKWVEGADENNLMNFATALLSRLLEEAKSLASMDIEIPLESDPDYLSYICNELIDNVPDAGNTPESIVGYLLEAQLISYDSRAIVKGYEEGASTTSTTSNKPGDIYIAAPNGDILAVYEVTVKPFDEQRIVDSAEAVKSFNDRTGSQVSEIIVVCREADLHPEALQAKDNTMHLAKIQHKGIAYQFVDIYRWVMATLCTLNPSARLKYYERLNAYIAKPNTSKKVKGFWKNLHERLSE